jgi:dTDP-4-amino-4,6-dideoxygalactose transaminase
MVTTENPVAAERIRLMRLHGIERDAWKRYRDDGSWRYEVLEAGFKYNLTDFQSAIGLVQLAKCDAMHQARQTIALRYTAAFSSHEELWVPEIRPECSTSWHLYILRLRLDRLRVNRDAFIRALKERGVTCSVHFIPLHLQPYYQRACGYKAGDFPQAEQQYGSCLSLPIFPGMTEQEIEHVIRVVQTTVEEFRVVRQNAAVSPIA